VSPGRVAALKYIRMKKKIYQWHRSLSIIIAIPVLLWAISGFMHPLMTNIRPAIATQGLPPAVIDSQRIHFSLRDALLKNHLSHFSNVRLVHIDTNWFYQVQPVFASGSSISTTPVPVYLSCTNGNALPAGDWLYAQYIARQFLEGPAETDHSRMNHSGMNHSGMDHMTDHGHPMQVDLISSPNPAHDCCGAATDVVLNPVKGAKVANVSLVRDFDQEYKNINRLLPVYRVSFARADGIRVYVETTKDRFAFAMDNRRAIFDEIFRLLHTWGWLDFLGKGKLAVEMLLAIMAFCTTAMGIYIFFVTKTKNIRGNRSRRYHRYVSIVACLFTLLWTFSGSFHAFSKFSDDTRDRYFVSNSFLSDSADLAPGRIQRVLQHPVANISLVKMDGKLYWQVYDAELTHSGKTPVKGGAEQPARPVDLMKDGKVVLPKIQYINTTDYSTLIEGDKKYAEWLSTQFSGHPPADICSTVPVTAFGDEYNFTDKRLPVWRVNYTVNSNERYYVETSTGRLSRKFNDKDLLEGYSFSLLHKHHFMDWGGKSIRDLSTMFWAFMQVLMVTIGLILYFKWRNKAQKA
jgi:hypothetical protein